MRRYIFLHLIVAALLMCGCDLKGQKDEKAFAELFRTGTIDRVDRIEFINYDEPRTNRIEGDQLRRFITKFDPKNQIPRSNWKRRYDFGIVIFFEGEKRIALLFYSPQGEFSYHNFNFILNGLTTNEILQWFK